MPVARVNGIDLHYEEIGEGPHLVVAHGLKGSVATLPLFGERIDAIAARGVHVIAYDARGHGRSGYTAVTLALDHPETVEKLILQSPPPTGVYLRRVRPMFLGLAMLVQVVGPRTTGRIVARLPRRHAASGFDISAFIGGQRRAAIVPAVRGLLRGPPLPIHRYGEIRQPALVLAHPDDPIHPLASGELLHERMPHAKLAVAPAPTYWAENPDGLAFIVAAFVRGEQIARGLPGHGSSRIS